MPMYVCCCFQDAVQDDAESKKEPADEAAGEPIDATSEQPVQYIGC